MKTNAKSIICRLLESDDETELHRHIDALPPRGRLLDTQPDTCDPVFYTHFDCWNDGDDWTGEPWPENDPRCAQHASNIALDLADSTGDSRFSALAGRYLELGHDEFFAQLGQLCIQNGFDVYSSENMFEVYPAADASNDNALLKHCVASLPAVPDANTDTCRECGDPVSEYDRTTNNDNICWNCLQALDELDESDENDVNHEQYIRELPPAFDYDKVLDKIQFEGSWCMDNKNDNKSFRSWIKRHSELFQDPELAIEIIRHNDSWCTDNLLDMTLFFERLGYPAEKARCPECRGEPGQWQGCTLCGGSGTRVMDCECDDEHHAADTVCSWCRAHGRVHWNDPAP